MNRFKDRASRVMLFVNLGGKNFAGGGKRARTNLTQVEHGLNAQLVRTAIYIDFAERPVMSFTPTPSLYWSMFEEQAS
jgi:hypothetical protein